MKIRILTAFLFILITLGMLVSSANAILFLKAGITNKTIDGPFQNDTVTVKPTVQALQNENIPAYNTLLIVFTR